MVVKRFLATLVLALVLAGLGTGCATDYRDKGKNTNKDMPKSQKGS
jgi:hypothetical protein